MYFFEQDEVRALLGAEPRGGTTGQPMFDVTQIGEDRRMVRVMIPDWRRVLMPDCEPEGEAADVPDMAAGQSDQEVVDGSGEVETLSRLHRPFVPTLSCCVTLAYHALRPSRLLVVRVMMS